MGVVTSKQCPIHTKEDRSKMENRQESRRTNAFNRCSQQTPRGEAADVDERADVDDVVFHVGQDRVMRISARKRVLSRKNDVFHAMFYGPYAQSHQHLRHRTSASPPGPSPSDSIDQIYEPDIEGRAFKNLINYLNDEPVELRSVVTAVETLHAAEKYLCQGLVKECVHYLASQLNTENVLQIFQRTRLYVPTDDPAQPSAPPLDVIDRSPSIDSLSAQQQQQEHEFRQLQQQQQLEQQQQRMSWCSYLINQCLEFIDKNASGVLASEEFEELDRETVAMIVSRDDLRLRNEIEVLMALLRWSVFECHRRQLDTTLENQRIVLDDLIWQVRYLTMSVEDLWKVPIVSQLLTSEECNALIGYISGQLTTADQLPPHLSCHLPQMAKKRTFYPWTSTATTCSQQVSSPSCRKSGMTEKIFVCLACIFE